MKYSITQVHKVVEQLADWIEQTTETLDNEEAKDYPNADRVENLACRQDALESAQSYLEEIE